MARRLVSNQTSPSSMTRSTRSIRIRLVCIAPVNKRSRSLTPSHCLSLIGTSLPVN